MPEAPKPRFGRMSVEEYRAKTVAGFVAIKPANKYNAKKTEYAGLLYDSKGEAGLAEQLDWKLKAKLIKAVKRQVPYTLIPDVTIVWDFVVTELDGSIVCMDYKGVETPVFKVKLKLFKHFYPGVRFELVRA